MKKEDVVAENGKKNKNKHSSANYSVSGNGMLHNLTSSRTYSLRVDLEDFNGNTAYASYSQFAVGSELDGFRLCVGGYSGTAGWCPQQHSKRSLTCAYINLLRAY